MSVTQQALAVGRGRGCTRPSATRMARRAAWFGLRLGGRVRPAVCRWCSSRSSFIRSSTGSGWAASRSCTAQLFADPRYLTAVLNTVLYVGIGVNVKMFLAFLLSGFFMRKRWWIKALLRRLHPAVGDAGAACLHVDPLVHEWPVGHAEQCPVSAVRHRRSGLSE